jgi:hypothetical protein
VRADLLILNNEFEIAWKNFDRKAMVLIANKITEKEICDSEGLEYLKLKIHALTFANEYQLALRECIKYLKTYQNSVELYIASGVLANKNGLGENEYFHAAINLLENVTQKTNQEKIFECYSLLVCNGEVKKVEVLLQSLPSEERKVIDFYQNSTRNELLLHPPIDFVAIDPLPDNIGSGDTNWWE